jgi:outer membrane biogenesis lipoprotein LolB
MLGLAAPGAHEWLESDTGPVLLQDGWRIEYGEFAENGSVRVPVRLKATAGETRVRLVIDRWNLEP